MTIYAADWILPVVGEPVRHGWICLENGRIGEVGSGRRDDAEDLGQVAILPALVNAHTHLELSYLRGEVPPADGFLEWVRGIMAARRAQPDPQAPEILGAARAALCEARAAGTGLIGDISNTLVTVPLLREASMPARVFYELLGFKVEDAAARVQAARTAVMASGGDADVRVALAPHAPYSVSTELFSAIREDLDAHPADVSSVHLGESPEEVELVERGSGGWRELLVALGVWNEKWRVPGTSPVRYLADSGFLDSRVLAVHGVQCSREDLLLLRSLGTTVVSCPRSNRHVGVGDPPLALFYEAGVEVAFGTDSLASVADLNVFSEIAAARRLAPSVPARTLIQSATLTGARALGFGDELGSIEPGKRGALIAIDLPEDVADVEEYVVSGIEPATIRWIGDSAVAPVAPSHSGTIAPSHVAPRA
ncbi:MAG: amidohydrolase family protein [Acidobacteria bacterium]|nr:amidohydrolase family protein [Acidobacteriota bacterium]